MKPSPDLCNFVQRRRVLGLGLALANVPWPSKAYAGAGAGADDAKAREARAAHFPFGPVLPVRALPLAPLVTHLDAKTNLKTVLTGRLTALQLMFTGCSATCPIQGALFAQAQQALPSLWPQAGSAVQWLSLSIDPLSDGPVQLARWLLQFGAKPGWLAAAPRVEDVDRLVNVLGTGGETRPRGSDPHTGQVYIINRKAELVFRTASMPAPATIIDALRRVDVGI